jgi:hypothetical protein
MHPVSRKILLALGSAWTLPNTLLGLTALVILMPFGARAHVLRGVVEIAGPPVKMLLKACFGGAIGVTFGQTVLSWNETTHRLAREHERVHVRQYLLWGPFFLPAYGLASLWVWLRGRDPYHANPFERQAYAIACIEHDPDEWTDEAEA